MGAWGSGIFDDDMALDAITAIEGSNDPKEFFRSSFETAINMDSYLDYDEGYSAIICAVYVDGILNGTSYGEAGKDVDFFVAEHKDLKVDDLKTKAVVALQKVIGDDSELNGLWSENEEDYLNWRKNIEAIIERLR